MLKKLIFSLMLVIVFTVPTISQASTNQLSIQENLLTQIQSLLTLISSLQQQLALVTRNQPVVTTITDFNSCVKKTGVILDSYPRQCTYNGQTFTEFGNVSTTPTQTCPIISQNLWRGMRGLSVISLQNFLRLEGAYKYSQPTGYFGPATQQAVQIWQAKNGVVNFGSPNTTGFGVVGPKTRRAIINACTTTIVEPKPPITPTVCTLEYSPKCGYINSQQNTYGNSCQLKASGAQYLYEGQCRGASGNDNPVINGFTGPTQLNINQQGTWTIRASDSQNGSLSYSIDWGDNIYRPYMSSSSSTNLSFVQNTTFTHSYKYAGTYTIGITVRNNQGFTTKVTTTVRVNNSIPTNTLLIVNPTSGNTPLTVTATITCVSYPGISWGDGARNSWINGCSKGRIVNLQHTYRSSGKYLIQYNNNQSVVDGVNKVVGTATVQVSNVPIANTLTATPTSGNAPLTVSFSWNKRAGLTYFGGFQINYGDGNSSPDTTDCPDCSSWLRHTYSTPGTYKAQITGLGEGRNDVLSTATVIVGSDSIANSVSISKPSGGTYTKGDNIQVNWTSSINSQYNSNAGMYLILQDSNGAAIKSQKVNIADGQATIKTGSFCNNFFSDGIDGSCNGLSSRIAKYGSSGFKVKAVIYTPANACFGYCPPNSVRVKASLAESTSNTFSIVQKNVVSTNTLSATPTLGNAPLTVSFAWNKPAGLTYFGGFQINYGDGTSSDLGRGFSAPDKRLIPNHTYTNPGTYKVQIIGRGEGVSNILITVIVTVI